jgi:hypothetical protein
MPSSPESIVDTIDALQIAKRRALENLFWTDRSAFYKKIESIMSELPDKKYFDDNQDMVDSLLSAELEDALMWFAVTLESILLERIQEVEKVRNMTDKDDGDKAKDDKIKIESVYQHQSIVRRFGFSIPGNVLAAWPISSSTQKDKVPGLSPDDALNSMVDFIVSGRQAVEQWGKNRAITKPMALRGSRAEGRNPSALTELFAEKLSLPTKTINLANFELEKYVDNKGKFQGYSFWNDFFNNMAHIPGQQQILVIDFGSSHNSSDDSLPSLAHAELQRILYDNYMIGNSSGLLRTKEFPIIFFVGGRRIMGMYSDIIPVMEVRQPLSEKDGAVSIGRNAILETALGQLEADNITDRKAFQEGIYNALYEIFPRLEPGLIPFIWNLIKNYLEGRPIDRETHSQTFWELNKAGVVIWVGTQRKYHFAPEVLDAYNILKKMKSSRRDGE